jgi:hypothetical protein
VAREAADRRGGKAGRLKSTREGAKDMQIETLPNGVTDEEAFGTIVAQCGNYQDRATDPVTLLEAVNDALEAHGLAVRLYDGGEVFAFAIVKRDSFSKI